MKLQAVIFDWAGTTVDYGSLCPVACFQAAFSRKGITLEGWEVHQFMGMRKRDHLRAVLGLESVAEQWRAMQDRAVGEADIEELYEMAEAALLDKVAAFADPVPHLHETVAFIRERELRIGSTSGYTENVMEILAARAAELGYEPDAWVASDQVREGRPAPWMVYRNMEKLNVYPTETIVKVGDTLADMAEGLNTHTWNIAVVESSSLMGASLGYFQAMAPQIREARVAEVTARFWEAGAHAVIPNLSALPELLEHIEERVAAGEKPHVLKRPGA